MTWLPFSFRRFDARLDFSITEIMLGESGFVNSLFCRGGNRAGEDRASPRVCRSLSRWFRALAAKARSRFFASRAQPGRIRWRANATCLCARRPLRRFTHRRPDRGDVGFFGQERADRDARHPAAVEEGGREI